MNYIKAEIANKWNDRLAALLKRDGYTQETFLEDFRKKYNKGTQANVSRWGRVGHAINSGKAKEIGFPSYENMKRIADFFGVDVGYLTGETDYETFEMEQVCTYLGISEDVGKAIRGVASGESIEDFGKHLSSKYSATLGFLVTAPSFPRFIKALRDMAQCIYEQQHPINHLALAKLEIDPSLREVAYECFNHMYDDEYENGVEVTEELIRAINLLEEADAKDAVEPGRLELNVKLAKYELQEIYFQMIKEITADGHLEGMATKLMTAEE